MLQATTLTQYPPSRRLLALRLQWLSALRAAILRSWSAACLAPSGRTASSRTTETPRRSATDSVSANNCSRALLRASPSDLLQRVPVRVAARPAARNRPALAPGARTRGLFVI